MQGATFFKLLYNKIWVMQFQCESLPRDTPSYADSKFHNQSTNAHFGIIDDAPTFTHNNIYYQRSEETPLDAGRETKSTDRIQGQVSMPIEKEIAEITFRFTRIQQVLLQHSQYESQLHEKVYGFKEMAIDWLQLSPDLTNKVSIVDDLRHLVTLAENQPPTADLSELLEGKFQEYYLERHYGGLRCEINDLSIQERGEQEIQLQSMPPKQIDYESMAFGYAQQSSSYDHSSASARQLQGLSSVQGSDESLQYINLREERRKPVSRIGFTSLVNESKLSYTQECCQTVEQHFSLTIEVPRFIEIQIPWVVYKVKEKVITYDESDLQVPYKDIDQIIDKYSRPYEELYIDSDKDIRNGIELSELPSIQQAGPSLQVGSIMLNSNVEACRQNREMTEVELSYSQLPEEQLLLNSFAQIGSLISQSPLQSNTIMITQKLNSRSILEKFEQSERLLNEENLQLKEKLVHLESQLQETQKKLKEASAMSKKLSDRLEEQIQQGVYLSKKLDQLDAELLEERVDCLTRLNDCKDNKIQNMQAEIAQQARQIDSLKCQLAGLKIENQKTEQLLLKSEQQLAQFSRQLQQREQELHLLNSCQDDIIKIVSETQISLKCQIQKLEQEKTVMREQLNEFQKRVESEGFNLQYEEAKEIQGIIESREHVFNVQLKEATDKYEEIINKYKQELDEMRLQLGQTLKQLADTRQQIRILNELSHAKSELHDTCATVKQKKLSDSYLNQFEAIIDEYDRELQAKDDEIMHLKAKFTQQSSKAVRHQDSQEQLGKAIAFIHSISSELERERQERMRITERLVLMDKMQSDSRKAIEAEQIQKYEVLVEQLSENLEKMITQNQNLKQKMHPKKKASEPKIGTSEVQLLRKEVQKLRRMNSKLKKYTVEMESELISISGMNRCQSHKLIITNVMKERDFFVEMLTKTSAN